VALGSNRASGAHRLPQHVLEAAIDQLSGHVTLIVASRLIETAALGPSARRFANGAILIETPLAPPALLALLKATERAFGRRPGRRWGTRPLDLDILLWSGGRVRRRALKIPHPALAERLFVLAPLAEIASDWRLPRTPFSVRHLKARLTRRSPRA